MSRATDDILDALHYATGETYLEEIRAYRAGKYKDAEGRPLPVPAALLTAAAKFLKDNGIDRPLAKNDPTDLLAQELPELPGNGLPRH